MSEVQCDPKLVRAMVDNDGLSLADIARRLGLHDSTVRKAFEKAYPGLIQERRAARNEAIIAFYREHRNMGLTARAFGITTEAVRQKLNAKEPGLIDQIKAQKKAEPKQEPERARTRRLRREERQAKRKVLMDEAIAIYRTYPSTNEVARRLGISQTYACKLIKQGEPGLMQPKGWDPSLIPRGKPGEGRRYPKKTTIS